MQRSVKTTEREESFKIHIITADHKCLLRCWYVVVIVQALIPSPSANFQNPQMKCKALLVAVEIFNKILHSVQVYSFGTDLL